MILLTFFGGRLLLKVARAAQPRCLSLKAWGAGIQGPGCCGGVGGRETQLPEASASAAWLCAPAMTVSLVLDVSFIYSFGLTFTTSPSKNILLYTCVNTHIGIYVGIYTYAHLYVCIHIYIHIHTCLRM